MMQVKDIEAKPFSTFETFQDPSFSDVFGTISASSLDYRFASKYGERETFPAVVLDGKFDPTALLGIWLTYADGWKRVRSDLGIEFDPTNPYKYDEKRDTSYKTEGSSTNNVSQANKVYGFDSAEGVGDTDRNDKSDSNNSRTDTTNETITRSGNTGATPTSDLVASDLRLRMNRFVDIVMADVRDELTLAIYE